MSDALVDVFCNELEVGRSLVLRDVGPTSAYLEHPTPMPVGAELRVHTDGGSKLGAVVVRVHEATSDAERPPGMFVRVVEIEGDAEVWWKGQVALTVDPQFPEPPANALPEHSARTNTLEMSPAELARMAAADRTETGGAPVAESVSPSELAKAADPLKQTIRDVQTTVKMSADQIKTITDQAHTDSAVAAAAPSDESLNGKPAGKKRKKRRKKKT